MVKIWFITIYKKFPDGHYEFMGYFYDKETVAQNIEEARWFHNEDVARKYIATFLSEDANMHYNVENRLA